MSLEAVDVPEATMDLETGDYQDPPQPPQAAQNKVTQDPNFIDGSGPIFSMYLDRAAEEDKKMAEAWQADAEGILIFTGLFSAVVASLISVSIQDIQENPQDTANFYLSNIYRTMADPNISSSLPASPPPFSPPKYAIWVNSFWFLSLVISITCALLATLLQQWARRYLKVTQPRYSPHKRTRIRAFFAEGVDKFLLPWAVEALPTLLHVALFLFFAGLAVFLWNINLTIFKLVLSWIALCTALYACITLVPLIRHDCPYHTSLSLPTWHIVTGIRFVTFRILQRFSFSLRFYAAHNRFWNLKQSYRKLLTQGMQKTAEETALKSPPEIDPRAFMWTFDSLDEDHELERFFASLPGFRNSKMVQDPLPDLTWEQQGRILDAWVGLSDRTLSSDLLPKRAKSRRTAVCARAFNPTDFPIIRVLDRIVSEDRYGSVQSAEIVRLVRGWDNGEGEETIRHMQAFVLSVVARAQRRDGLWFATASDEMGVRESVLRNHATHGDNLSLAILIHVTRQQFSRFEELHWPWPQVSKVIKAASNFNAQDTSPELQHEFCALWNQIVLDVQGDNKMCLAFFVLRRIRNVYVALHQGTDAAPTLFSASTDDEDRILWDPFAYPLCNIPTHHPYSNAHVSATTAIPRTVMCSSALIPAPITSTPDAASPPILARVHTDENSIVAPLFNNNMSGPASFHPAHWTAAGGLRDSATSPDPAIASTVREIKTSTRSMPPTTDETSISPSSIPLTGAGSNQNNADLAHSDAADAPSSAVLELELKPDDTLLTVSHLSIPASTSFGTSPWPSAPELSAVASDKGTDSREDRVALDPPSVNRAIQANTMAILDPLLQPPSQPSATDLANASPSLREPNAEHTGDHPPYTSHGQYGIV